MTEIEINKRINSGIYETKLISPGNKSKKALERMSTVAKSKWASASKAYARDGSRLDKEFATDLKSLALCKGYTAAQLSLVLEYARTYERSSSIYLVDKPMTPRKELRAVLSAFTDFLGMIKEFNALK